MAVDLGNDKCLMIPPHIGEDQFNPCFIGILKDSEWIRQIWFQHAVKQAIFVQSLDKLFTLHTNGSIKLMSTQEILSTSSTLRLKTILIPEDPPPTAIYFNRIHKTFHYIRKNKLFRLTFPDL